jgi:hypothetical protein
MFFFKVWEIVYKSPHVIGLDSEVTDVSKKAAHIVVISQKQGI